MRLTSQWLKGKRAKFRKLPNPNLLFLAFFAFSLCEEFLVFFLRFPLFLQRFRGSAERRKPCLPLGVVFLAFGDQGHHAKVVAIDRHVNHDKFSPWWLNIVRHHYRTIGCCYTNPFFFRCHKASRWCPLFRVGNTETCTQIAGSQKLLVLKMQRSNSNLGLKA